MFAMKKKPGVCGYYQKICENINLMQQRLNLEWCRCGRLAIYGDRCEDCWAEDQARYDGRITRRARIELAYEESADVSAKKSCTGC